MLLIPSTAFRAVLSSSTRPSLDLNFLTGSLDSRITFTRASKAWYFDGTGTLQQANTNAPRFDYDPMSLSMRGLLIEEPRTNSVRNPRGEGVTAGTPGTLPTNWTTTGGLTSVAINTENGIPCIDIRLRGASASGLLISFEAIGAVAASSGQVWSASQYARLIAGSLTNVTDLETVIRWYDNTNTFISQDSTSTFTPTSAPVATQRYSQANKTAPALTASAVNAIRFNASGAYDFTLRIGLPQLELGAFVTSPIMPPAGTPAASTRAIEIASMPTGGWFNSSLGSLRSEVILGTTVNRNSSLASLDDGNNAVRNNVIDQFVGAGATPVSSIRVGNVNNGSLNFGLLFTTAGAVYRFATTYSASRAAGSAAGSAIQSTTPTLGVPPISRLLLGSEAWGGVVPLCGWFRRFTYWPRVRSDSELQAASGNSYDDYTLDLNFLDGTALNNTTLSFTRASGATYFDATKTMQLAGNNVPRLDHDPVTGAALGLLIEEARTNLEPSSLSLSNGSYIRTARFGGSSLSTAIPPPYAGASVVYTVDSSGSGDNNCGSNTAVTVTTGSTYVSSLYVWIPASYTGSAVGFGTPGGWTGTTAVNADMTKRDQWQRIWMVGTPGTSPTGWVLRPTTNLGDFFYWCMPQFELGAFPTSYIPTSGSAATRALDSMQLSTGSWLGNGVGSIVSEDELLGTVGGENYCIFTLGGTGGPGVNSIEMQNQQSSTVISLLSLVNSANTNLGGSTGLGQFTPFKCGVTYNIGSPGYTWALNGGTVLTNTPASMPVGISAGVDNLYLGGGRNAKENGWKQRIRVWSRQLSNTELSQVTT